MPMNTNAFHISRTVGVVIAFVIVLGGAIFYMTTRTPSTDETVLTTDGPASQSEATFVMLATQLDSIAFDTSVLNDPRFLILTDIHTAVTPENSGRNDPFAPLGR